MLQRDAAGYVRKESHRKGPRVLLLCVWGGGCHTGCSVCTPRSGAVRQQNGHAGCVDAPGMGGPCCRHRTEGMDSTGFMVPVEAC